MDSNTISHFFCYKRGLRTLPVEAAGAPQYHFAILREKTFVIKSMKTEKKKKTSDDGIKSSEVVTVVKSALNPPWQ